MKKKTKKYDSRIEQQRNRASVLPLESGNKISAIADSTRYSRTQPRGQISAEFVITLVLLFLMFSLVVAVSVEQKKNIDFNSEKIKAKTLSEKIARNINGIYISGEGSKTIITKNYDFEIEFEENSVKIKFRQGQFISTSLLTKKLFLFQKLMQMK